MRATLSSSVWATQTAPLPTAMPLAPGPTGTVAVTPFVAGSIRDTVASRSSATQTAPAPTAMPLGSLPTLILAFTALVVGSTRMIAESPFDTHTEPAPTAMGPECCAANGERAPTGTDCPSRSNTGSIERAATGGPAPRVQTRSPAVATAETPEPVDTVLTTRPAR